MSIQSKYVKASLDDADQDLELAPKPADLLQWVEKIRALIAVARGELLE